ncbi:hypothetical protein CRM22_008313 [Opisthorchis felineus]|uniref:Aromatic-L-amino-acid decarboxylase n=4 Tax=Opisthorchis felineus TaxID=147828 RepID=A0A4S2LK43_OPIFE|nr:hypothetical protein CRM22_008313 [Opisthorchis felineus]
MGNLTTGFSRPESPHLRDISVNVKATQNGRCEDPKSEMHSLLAPKEFREQGCRMVNYIVDYLENADKLRVFPTVEPGYLASLIPKEAPEETEPWSKIMEDVERVIMPGITHWQHPRFHAYFPSGSSCPSMCADILTNGFACIGFTWASSPAYTELEIVMMDWLAKLLQLPEYFLSGGDGGGVIQGSCSEATLVSLCGARNRAINRYQKEHPGATVYEAASKLVGYYSDQAHCSVERSGLISMLRLRPIRTTVSRQLNASDLEASIKEDVSNGFVPFFCVAALGTTGCCAFDNMKEIGPICEKYDIWLHVDAAYAGSVFICPEFRPLLDGIEYAMSFVFNPHKWLLTNFDCSCVWFKKTEWIVKSFCVNPTYLRYKDEGRMPDLRHWQIPFGRKFRSLKLWFVMRRFGVHGLQQYIRNHIDLAHKFERLMLSDQRFEIVHKVTMGLVCFRIKEDNELTRKLYHDIEADGRIHLTPSEFHHPEEVYFIRFAVCHPVAEEAHINYAFQVVQEMTDQLLPRL